MGSTKVLIVEDEGIVARDLQQTLKKLGYDVGEWVATGEEGVEKARSENPDLVLMDIHLGAGVNGVEAATQIRERFDTPVIFLTAYSDKPTLEGAKTAQPYGYILKPFDENELRTNIEVALYKHRMEKEVKESRRFLASLISNFPGFIYRCRLDKPMTLTYISGGIREVSGYSEEELLDRAPGEWDNVRHPDDRLQVTKQIRKAIAAGVSYELEYRIMGKNGEVRWVLEKGFRVPSNAGDGGDFEVEGFVTDITKRKKAGEVLLQKQKLESLGGVAAGIAHDFNNYLMAVSNGIYLIKLESEPGSGIHKKAQMLEDVSDRIRNLTGQLLTFSRGGEPVFTQAKVVPLVKDTARLIFKGSASVAQVTVQKDIRDIKADVGQIGQVLQSVLLNALEASPEGAPVEIKISNMDLPAEKDPVLTEGRYVRVLVRNTGPGIPNENIQKIFDPFYTTKPGRSGLGLSAAYSIVRKHQGSITVESKGQKGTSVSVYIPVWMEDSGKSIGSSAQPSSPIRRILLMDDDEHVQGFLKEVLTHMGYQVEACYDGEEAIRLYREKGEARNPYDCVILDLTVPNGMGGREAAEGILSFDSNARMIASSGYSMNPVMGNYKKSGFIGVLPKPYRARDLERVLDRVLSARNNE